jgi:hypothetical protein
MGKVGNPASLGSSLAASDTGTASAALGSYHLLTQRRVHAPPRPAQSALAANSHPGRDTRGMRRANGVARRAGSLHFISVRRCQHHRIHRGPRAATTRGSAATPLPESCQRCVAVSRRMHERLLSQETRDRSKASHPRGLGRAAAAATRSRAFSASRARGRGESQ